MKTLFAIVATAMLLAACAGGGPMMLGGCPRSAGEVPSGCQVPGHAGYYMPAGSTEVVQVANAKTARHMLRTSRDTNLGGQ